PERVDGGQHAGRPGGGQRRRTDQDGLGGPQRAAGEVQSAPPHRGRDGRRALRRLEASGLSTGVGPGCGERGRSGSPFSTGTQGERAGAGLLTPASKAAKAAPPPGRRRGVSPPTPPPAPYPAATALPRT